MQLVPLIYKPVVGIEDSRQVSGVVAVKRSKPVQERTLPPLVNQPHEQGHIVTEVSRQNKRHETEQADRRLFCRRTRHLPVLEELRSAIERRKHNLRHTDLQMHIDEEV